MRESERESEREEDRRLEIQDKGNKENKKIKGVGGMGRECAKMAVSIAQFLE